MFACLNSRQFHLMLLLLLAGLLSTACQTVPEQDDAAAIENAKKKPIIFRAIDNAPPRDISDIRKLLAQAADKPVRPEASAIVAQQPPQSDDKSDPGAFLLAARTGCRRIRPGSTGVG